MTEAESALYRSLAEKAKEWAAGLGLSDEYGMGALNAMWYTIRADHYCPAPELSGALRQALEAGDDLFDAETWAASVMARLNWRSLKDEASALLIRLGEAQ